MAAEARILFVDDEPHVLNGIRRALRDMQGRWEMTFCASAAEALAAAAGTSFDVVVSDMRMPGMDGADLLETFRHRHPAAMRLILSGYADTEAVLRTVGPAHLYLAKPCDREALLKALSRAIAVKRLVCSEGLRALLSGLTTLPTLPDLFLQVTAELQSSSASPKVVADIIGRDMAMTAEIMKLTNSAYFSVGGRIGTPLQAVRTLGLETVQALVLRAGIFRQFSGSAAVAPKIAALTAHSRLIAGLAEAMAKVEGGEAATAKAAHYAGMLSFLGCLVLLDGRQAEYQALLDEMKNGQVLVRQERERFGADHAAIGAYLLGLWGFAEEVVEAVAFCCAPGQAPVPDNPVLLALHVARALGPPMPLLAGRGHDCAGLDEAYLRAIGKADRAAAWRDLAAHLCDAGH